MIKQTSWTNKFFPSWIRWYSIFVIATKQGSKTIKLGNREVVVRRSSFHNVVKWETKLQTLCREPKMNKLKLERIIFRKIQEVGKKLQRTQHKVAMLVKI